MQVSGPEGIQRLYHKGKEVRLLGTAHVSKESAELVSRVISEEKPDSWYMDIAKKVYRPDIYTQAAKSLIAEGKMSADEFPDFASEDGFKPPQSEFIDNITYDGRKPNAYLSQFPIGLKDGETL